jgi:hypothetical protein
LKVIVMRKLLISLLLTSAVASPALAQRDDSDAQQARAERQQMRAEARESRSSDADRSARVERFQARSSDVDRAQHMESRREARAQFEARAQAAGQADSGDLATIRAAREARRQQLGTDQNERLVQRQQVIGREGDLRESTRPVPNVFRNRVPIVANEPREGTQPPQRLERHSRDSVRWNTNWRHDSRHDWRRWRDRHHSLFRLGFYSDPFGWNYRPYSIGWRMWPSYYSGRYWINDPWQYRLPYAPPGYRWIRYWDDAILVDTWSGQVVDVIHNFFW